MSLQGLRSFFLKEVNNRLTLLLRQLICGIVCRQFLKNNKFIQSLKYPDVAAVDLQNFDPHCQLYSAVAFDPHDHCSRDIPSFELSFLNHPIMQVVKKTQLLY